MILKKNSGEMVGGGGNKTKNIYMYKKYMYKVKRGFFLQLS